MQEGCPIKFGHKNSFNVLYGNMRYHRLCRVYTIHENHILEGIVLDIYDKNN